MTSEFKTNKISPATGTTLTVGDSGDTVDLSTATVTLPAASVTDHVTQFDDNQLKEEIALLGFRTAANGSLAKYNLVDQTIDAFEDSSGVSSGSCVNEAREGTGKYYSGSSGGATGGTEVISGDYKYHTFIADGNLVVEGTVTSVEYLVVAGGGGGGGQTTTSWGGGGGGAGGYRSATGQTITAGTMAVVVGDGGAGGASANDHIGVIEQLGDSGGVSSFNSFESAGGGGGGTFGGGGYTGTAGGSGGGGAGNVGSAGNTPSTSPVQGYAGGERLDCNDNCSGGGGGGAGSVGHGSSDGDVDGGIGSNTHSAWATITSTGDGGYFAGGGGGGDGQGSASVTNVGGSGGGGDGGDGSAGTGSAATANTGGGGGGGSYGSGAGGAGGKGIVIIKRPAFLEGANMTLVSTTTTAQAAPTKGDIVFTYSNGAGSTTLGTDVTAEYSADGGSTWTAMTLGSEGSTGGHNIATAHDVTLTSTSGTSMAYRIKTLNQSANKTTRIQAVSLGWS
jgi:hypothetical protein